MPPPAAPRDPVRPGDLLDLWERAALLAPVERALALAAARLGDGLEGDPGDGDGAGTSGPDVADLRGQPVGRTHARLLALHERLRGPRLEVRADCPRCAAQVQLELATPELLATKPGRPESVLVHGDRLVTWRSPTPEDLIAVAGSVDGPSALAARCLSVTTADGTPVEVDDLDPAVGPLVDDLVAEADPLAEIVAVVTCPDCALDLEVDLDPVVLVWAEVEAAAHRLLHEVDVLARAYGWTQADVLALGERRRAAYLSLVLEGVP